MASCVLLRDASFGWLTKDVTQTVQAAGDAPGCPLEIHGGPVEEATLASCCLGGAAFSEPGSIPFIVVRLRATEATTGETFTIDCWAHLATHHKSGHYGADVNCLAWFVGRDPGTYATWRAFVHERDDCGRLAAGQVRSVPPDVGPQPVPILVPVGPAPPPCLLPSQ